MDKLELEVRLTLKQYYRFNLYNCYHSFSGIIGVLLGLLLIFYGVAFGILRDDLFTVGQTVLFLVAGVVILVYNPVALYMRSKRRFLMNEVMKEAVTYIFGETGITLQQGEIKEEMLWENIYKIVKSKESMIFYLTKYNANVIPLCEMEGHYDEVCEYIRKYVDPRAIKFSIGKKRDGK